MDNLTKFDMFTHFYVTVIISMAAIFVKQSKRNTCLQKMNVIQIWAQIRGQKTKFAILEMTSSLIQTEALNSTTQATIKYERETTAR